MCFQECIMYEIKELGKIQGSKKKKIEDSILKTILGNGTGIEYMWFTWKIIPENTEAVGKWGGEWKEAIKECGIKHITAVVN